MQEQQINITWFWKTIAISLIQIKSPFVHIQKQNSII